MRDKLGILFVVGLLIVLGVCWVQASRKERGRMPVGEAVGVSALTADDGIEAAVESLYAVVEAVEQGRPEADCQKAFRAAEARMRMAWYDQRFQPLIDPYNQLVQAAASRQPPNQKIGFVAKARRQLAAFDAARGNQL